MEELVDPNSGYVSIAVELFCQPYQIISRYGSEYRPRIYLLTYRRADYRLDRPESCFLVSARHRE